MASNLVAQCRCCRMCEECTADYIRGVKDQFGGVWLCGLCEEAVKDEQARLEVGIEAAMQLHSEFREAAASVDPAICIYRSLVQLLKKISSSSPTPTVNNNVEASDSCN